MKCARQLAFIYIVVGFILTAQAQVFRAGSIWYRGGYSGFDFKTDPPTILYDGKMRSLGNRPSTLADELGNLLMYTNGDTVWNKHHEIMDNGVGLNGYYSGNPYTSVIVPHPGDGQLYYIFTTNRGNEANYPPSGFIYSVVDLSGNGGNGRVLQKNIRLIERSTTLLSVTSHANERSFWVITHGYDDNRFYAYLVSETGISQPVISHVGPHYRYNTWQLKASPDATKIGVTNNGLAELYDFNSMTGMVTNYRSLGPLGAAGVEFSPNSELLYFSTYESINGRSAVFQFDVRTPDLSSILASKIKVGNKWVHGNFGDLQLAANGKIYVALHYGGGADSLIFVDAPNIRGLACGYTNNGIVPPVNLYSWLPLSVQSYYRDSPALITQPACKDVPTELWVTSLGYADSLVWDLGDGTKRSYKSASGKIIHHTYSRTGEFAVRVTKYIGNVYREINSTIKILEKPVVDLGCDTILCEGEEIVLNAGEKQKHYVWSTGETSQEVRVDTEGQYTVLVNNGACTTSDTINIDVWQYPKVNLGPDQIICDRDSKELSVELNPAYTYRWSTREETNTVLANTSGDYGVTVSHGRCSNSDEVHLQFAQVKNLQLENSAMETKYDEELSISAQGLNIDSWRWTFGDGSEETTTESFITHRYEKAGHYSGQLYVSNSFGCTDRTFFEVNVPLHLFIPNVFTPNNDGVNDEFEIQYNGSDDVNVLIYNRWGELLFSAGTLERFWSGTNVSSGTYYYRISTDKSSYNGCVTILR